MIRVRDFRAIEWDRKRWPNFSPAELACQCGGRFCRGEYVHSDDFVDALQGMRARIGKPISINSAHRCSQWNAAVGGAPLSQHKAIAVDISLAGQDPRALLTTARAEGFTGFGFHSGFLHLDRRIRPAVWTYGARSLAAWRDFLEGELWKKLSGS